jgi:sulfur-oxidizing protein SoxZ
MADNTASDRITRARVNLPPRLLAGQVFEVRTAISHPMETGHRVGATGERLPRNIVTRFEARLDGAVVFAADLYPAITANPYLAFPLRITHNATLDLQWQGDHGFEHRETVALVVG